jgi:competence protein ComEC
VTAPIGAARARATTARVPSASPAPPAASAPAASAASGSLGTDRRLLLPAAAGWSAAYWATGGSSGTAEVAVVVVALPTLLAALLLALRARQRFRGPGTALRRLSGTAARPPSGTAARRSPGRAGRLLVRELPAAVLVLAATTAVLAATAVRLADREAGALPGWIRERATVEVHGQLASDPSVVAPGRFPGPPRVAVAIQVDEVVARGRRQPTSVPMIVLAPAGSGAGSWSAVTAGQQVRLQGRLAPTTAGDDAVALVTARGDPSEVRAGSWPWRAADRVRAGLRDACRGLSGDSRGLLPSLVVGDTSALPQALRDDLQRAGLTHLTAVSGANVAITIGAVSWTVAAAGASRRLRLLISAAAVAGFVVLARPSPSVLRAAVMAVVGLTGLAAGRRPRGVPVLASAVIVLLGVDPWLARSPGFALSVVATGGLLLLAPLWADRLARRMPRPLAVALAAPAAAQAACGPVLVLLSPSVCPVAVPANLLAEPAVAPATLLGVAAAAVSLPWPWAAHLLAVVGGLATDWIALVAHRAAVVPGGNVPWPGGLAGALALAAVTGLLVLATARSGHRPARSGAAGSGGGPSGGGPSGGGGSVGWPGTRRGRWRPPWSLLLLMLAALPAGWYLFPPVGPLQSRRPVPPGWQLALCDVGQGDALVLRSGPDRAVLVDAGPDPGPVDGCLGRLGIRHLDLVVVTHLHADHTGGLAGALNGRDVAAALVSPLQQPAATAKAVSGALTAAGAQPRTAWAGNRGGCGRDGWAVDWRVLEPLAPPVASGDVGATDGTVVNESSVALVLDVRGPGGRVRVLDLGDLETGRQRGLADRLASGAETLGGPVDVVKVAHHGSSRQVEDLYAASGARLALVGVGAGNDYGHPAASALALLAREGIATMRTDRDGDLVVEAVDGALRVSGR